MNNAQIALMFVVTALLVYALRIFIKIGDKQRKERSRDSYVPKPDDWVSFSIFLSYVFIVVSGLALVIGIMTGLQ